MAFDNLFCSNCNNFLHAQYLNDKISLYCSSCKRIDHDSTPLDTLRFEDDSQNKTFMYDQICSVLHLDPVAMKQKKKCPQCKIEVIVKETRDSTTLHLINKCLKCHKVWFE